MKKCKTCSAIFEDTHKYCHECGAPAPLYPTFASKAGAFGKGLLFVAFFFAVQSVASYAYSLLLFLSTIVKEPGLLRDVSGLLNALYNALGEDLLSAVSEIGIISSVLTFLGLFLFFKIRRKRLFAETGLNKRAGAVGIAVVLLGISSNYMISLLQAMLPVPEIFSELYEAMYGFLGQGNFIVEFISVAICAPIVEELVFRGLCYGTMRKVMPMWTAVLLSSVIFGFAHANPISFVYTSVLGMALAYLYEESGSLWTPILLHFGFNAGSYLVQLSFPEADLLYYSVVLFVSTVLTVLLLWMCARSYKARRIKAATLVCREETEDQASPTDTSPAPSRELPCELPCEPRDPYVAEPQSSEAEAMPQNSEADAEPQSSKAEAMPQNSEADAEPQNSEADAEPQNSEADAEPQNSKAETEPQNSEADAEPQNSKADAEPQNNVCENSGNAEDPNTFGK